MIGRICSVSDSEMKCTRAAVGNGLCAMHYRRLRDHGDVGPASQQRVTRLHALSMGATKCSLDGCDRMARSKKMCQMHYKRNLVFGSAGHVSSTRYRNQGENCSGEVGGIRCQRPASSLGLCAMHHSRHYRNGDIGSMNPSRSPAGSGSVTADGYRIFHLPEHPNSRKNGQVFEHVMVMSEILERPLRPGESVHHKNGKRADNRPENLELWMTGHRWGQRVSDSLAYAVELLTNYIDQPSVWPAELEPMRQHLLAGDPPCS